MLIILGRAGETFNPVANVHNKCFDVDSLSDSIFVLFLYVLFFVCLCPAIILEAGCFSVFIIVLLYINFWHLND